jgi:hypothetical protein
VTVYVDNMYLYPMGKYGRMKMSHMIADTTAELVQMATRVGVNPKWIQHANESGEHFDICMSMRTKAICYGARPITLKQCSLMSMRRRVEGVLGTPEEALAWRLELKGNGDDGA